MYDFIPEEFWQFWIGINQNSWYEWCQIWMTSLIFTNEGQNRDTIIINPIISPLGFWKIHVSQISIKAVMYMKASWSDLVFETDSQMLSPGSLKNWAKSFFLSWYVYLHLNQVYVPFMDPYKLGFVNTDIFILQKESFHTVFQLCGQKGSGSGIIIWRWKACVR